MTSGKSLAGRAALCRPLLEIVPTSETVESRDGQARGGRLQVRRPLPLAFGDRRKDARIQRYVRRYVPEAGYLGVTLDQKRLDERQGALRLWLEQVCAQRGGVESGPAHTHTRAAWFRGGGGNTHTVLGVLVSFSLRARSRSARENARSRERERRARRREHARASFTPLFSLEEPSVF